MRWDGDGTQEVRGCADLCGLEAVQTVKHLQNKQVQERSGDPYLALLNCRATPLPWCGLSQAELLMGRRLRTSIPQTDELLIPNWSYLPDFQQKNQEFKDKQKLDFDRWHRPRQLPDLPLDTDVWIKSEGQPLQGWVVSDATRPRSYMSLKCPSGQVQCNHKYLYVIPQDPSEPAWEKHHLMNVPQGLWQEHKLGLPSFPQTDWLEGGDVVWSIFSTMLYCCVSILVWFRIIKVATLAVLSVLYCWVASKIFAEHYIYKFAFRSGAAWELS